MKDYIIVKATDESSLREALVKRLSKYNNPDYRIINMEYVAGYYQMYIEIENPITLDDDIYVRDEVLYTSAENMYDFDRQVEKINKKYIREGYDILEVVNEKGPTENFNGNVVQVIVQRRRLRRKKNH